MAFLRVILAATLAGFAACGGNDGTHTFRPSSVYFAKCASPRSGIDPATGAAYRDTRGTVGDEKSWLRSWIDELYLWYREVPATDPARYATATDYFKVLKTPASTASGAPKDRFHFTYPTVEWRALSQSGVQAGYGVRWAIIAPRPPRQVVAAYNEPDSPAATEGVDRGTQVLTIDGVDVASGGDVDTINAGLFPSDVNQTHTFLVLNRDAASPRTVTLTSAAVQSTPVQSVASIATASGPVGYLVFNDHIATAEVALIAAINLLKSAGVTDLVLDMRYNGGGYLAIAGELAYMIAGSASTAGKVFEQSTFNDKYPETNPITHNPIRPTPFFDRTLGFSTDAGQPLPSLGLTRVFILTGPSTCSASEAVMNGLQGVNVQVIQIGSTTCGKPYGFYPQDNCGTTYFAIEFTGVNDKGFGSYADGFTPGGRGPAGLPGCEVADDFTHALGDPNERRLAAALGYRASMTCTPPAGVGLRDTAAALSATDGQVIKSPWHENRILGE